jgi:hypothetical protein
MGCDGSLLRLADGDLASGPRPCDLDGTLRSIIGAALLKKRQDTFRTLCRPCRQEMMFDGIQKAAAMDCYKPLVSHG